MTAQAQPATCGECRHVWNAGLQRFLVELCPKHAQAEALLKAAMWALPFAERFPLPTFDQQARDRHAAELGRARAAIAAARPQAAAKGGAG
jgi:hypothetical protein